MTINYLPSGVQYVEEARLRVDNRSLLVSVLDRWVVVVDEVVLRDFFLKRKILGVWSTWTYCSVRADLPTPPSPSTTMRYLRWRMMIEDSDDDDDEYSDDVDGG